MQFTAGVGSEDITPPPGVRLSGFAGRPGGNTGVRDPLRASVLYLRAGESAGVVVTLDTIGLAPHTDALFRETVAARTNTTPDAVMICCSHTHSGAATMTIRATGDMDDRWTEVVHQRIAAAATAARSDADAVDASVGRGYAFSNINRRFPTSRGVSIQPYPFGPVDSTCRALLLERQGHPYALLVHYEMHPVSLGPGNLKCSADWVDAMRDRLEETLDCPVLFLQGCCGDINPRVRGEDDICDALGLDVAGSVLTALGGAHRMEVSRIGSASAIAEIPVNRYPPGDELKSLQRASREQVESLGTSTDRLTTLHMQQAYLQWAAACMESQSANEAPASVLGRISALSFGEITLIGLPGEIFTEIGAAVRERVPGAWPLGYTNGNLGYLYPDEALAAGGYEVDVAYRLYGELQAGCGTADALVQAAAASAARARH